MTKTYSTNGIDYEIRVGTNGDKTVADVFRKEKGDKLITDVFRKVYRLVVDDCTAISDIENMHGLDGAELLIQECQKYLDNKTP